MNRDPNPVTAFRLPAAQGFYTSPADVEIGTVVYDQFSDLAGVVRDVIGDEVHIERPSGMTWRIHYRRVLAGTARHAAELAVLHAEIAKRRHGLP